MEKITILDCPVWYDKTSMLDMLSLAAGRAFLCQNSASAVDLTG